ncbi:MAG: PA14 domain-containing protein [Patescibacteria group bacterium]|nr:PA14 domain-containing protein [Patescibacteria group bacterium]
MKRNNIKNKIIKKNIIMFFSILFTLFLSGIFSISQAATCKGPADVILTLDYSASMTASEFDFIKQASKDFIYKNESGIESGLFSTNPTAINPSNRHHQVGLLVYNYNTSSWSLTQTYSIIQNVLSADPGPLSDFPSGGRYLSGAILKSRTALTSTTNDEATKTMIIIFGGPTTESNASLAENELQIAHSLGIRIIAIGVGLDELIGSNKTNAENFIRRPEILPSDCYYIPADASSPPLANCNSISSSQLDIELQKIYESITASVCDESPPTISITRSPSGTLYATDKFKIKSTAVDDIGFKKHNISWTVDAVSDSKTDCNLFGQTIVCETDFLGSFVSGTAISYASSAFDLNDNHVKIDPEETVIVATASFYNPSPLFRNVEENIQINVIDPSGQAFGDDFYIRVDNIDSSTGIKKERVINENNISSKMNDICSGTGSNRICGIDFVAGCDIEGVYPYDTVDVYVYAKSGGVFHSLPIASSLGNILAPSPGEGVLWPGTCSNGIDDDCDGMIDGTEASSCDGSGPTVSLSRTSPIETDEFYDDDVSMTLKSVASDSNGILKNYIYYRVGDTSPWSTYYCNDVDANGFCDEHPGVSSANILLDINSFPTSPGTVVEYYSKVTDFSENENVTTTPTKFFIVKSRECDAVSNGDNCLVSTGKCCDLVCNISSVNTGSPDPYDSNCAKEVCNGTILEKIVDPAKNNLPCMDEESGESSGCFSFTPSVLQSPLNIPTTSPYDVSPYSPLGCEKRDYNCFGGYCNYGVAENDRKLDGCDILATPRVFRDFECNASNECMQKGEWSDIRCDNTLTYSKLTVADGTNTNMTGAPEVLDSKTNMIKISAHVADPNGIAEYKIFWRVNGGVWQEKNCGSCPSGVNVICDCTQEVGPFNHGDFVNYYMWAKDASPNSNEKYVGLEGGLNYDYYTHSYIGTDRKGTYKGSDIDISLDHTWGSTIQINADNVWEDQNDAAMTWEGFITPDVIGEYKIYAQSDDGIKVYINGEEVISYWGYLYPAHTGTHTFNSLDYVPIKIIWFDGGRTGRMRLGWLPPGETTEIYPIPATNLIAPYALAVRDSECYDIPINYSPIGAGSDKVNLELCDFANGRCCGGYCDSSKSNTYLYDDECAVDACSVSNPDSWITIPANAGIPCGTPGCFDYYNGCFGQGNLCSSGYCEIDPGGIKTDKCVGNILDENNGCSAGTCGFIDGGTDCSSSIDSDGDGIACACDCGGYDIEEKVYSSMKFDGINDSVYVGTDLISDDMSIEFWLKPDLIGDSSQRIIHNGNGAGRGPGPEINIFVAPSGYLYFRGASSYATSDIFTSTTISSEWTHIVGVLDSSNGKAKLYKNGNQTPVYVDSWSGTFVKVDTLNGIDLNDFKNFSISGRAGRRYAGLLDELRVYNRALYPEEIEDHYNGIFADNTGLVSYWDFDEGTGEIVGDSSGNGNDGSLSNVDGTLYNMDESDWVNGKYGYGLDFDGINDYVKTNSFSIPNTNNVITFSGWINNSKKTAHQTLIADATQSGSTGFLFLYRQYDNDYLIWQFAFGTSYSYFYSSSNFFTGYDNQWVYVTAVVDYANKTAKFYRNGELINTATTTLNMLFPNLSRSKYIGSYNSSAHRFDGLMDDVRIYNRALSDAEVEEHYKGVFTDNSGLVGYWNFNEGTGTVVNEISGNGPQWVNYGNGDDKDSAGNPIGILNRNVPVPWQVCTDTKDNDCDLISDENVVNNSYCDGEVETVSIKATSKKSGVVQGNATAVIDTISGKVISVTVVDGGSGYVSDPKVEISGGGASTAASISAILTGDIITDFFVIDGGSGYTSVPIVTISGGDILSISQPFASVYNNSIDSVNDDFTLTAMASDSLGISQILIEWTNDNWKTTGSVSCNNVTICSACVFGGSCANPQIDPVLLKADSVFKYRAIAVDNSSNNNIKKTSEQGFVVLHSNISPYLTNLIITEPDFCKEGLKYKLYWAFNDADLDIQDYYEIQVKEGNDDFSVGPFVVNIKKVAVDGYHQINKGENMVSGLTVTGVANNYIENGGALWITDEWKGGIVKITSGTGIGQERVVLSNDINRIYMTSNWTTNPAIGDTFEVTSMNLEYGSKSYYWRVRVTDNHDVYPRTSDWVVYDDLKNPDGDGNSKTFTTPQNPYPVVDFVAHPFDNSVNPPVENLNKECAYETYEDTTSVDKCLFGEDIIFHKTIGCASSDSNMCLSLEKSRCDDVYCVECTDNSTCNKFNGATNYVCNSGVCQTASNVCNNDSDCKSTNYAKCEVSECVQCDADSQCTKFGLNYLCNGGKCEYFKKLEWDFFGDLSVDSTDSDPINNYVESVFDVHDVSLKATDIEGKFCIKTKKIPFGGDKYPKWNEVHSSN